MVFCHTSTRTAIGTSCPLLPYLPPVSLLIPPFSLSPSPCLRSLTHTADSHWLSYFTYGTVEFPCYSLHTSPFSLLPFPVSIGLFLHCCPENKFISAISSDSIYMCQCMILIFLFVTYFTLYNRLWVCPSH